MERIVWSEELSVGVSDLDSQHQELVRMLNSLIAGIEEEIDPGQLSEMLTRLIVYGQRHFAQEEDMLREHGFPGLEDQKEDHQEFRLKTAEFCLQSLESDDTTRFLMIDFLTSWLTKHVLQEDMKYKEFLNSKGVY